MGTKTAAAARSRINKRDFIARVSERSELAPSVVADVYEALEAEIIAAVSRGETVVLTGFGRFYRQDHKGHKVRFGKSDVEDYYVLKFSAVSRINRLLAIDTGEDPTRPTYGMIEYATDFEDPDDPGCDGRDRRALSVEASLAV